MDQLASEWSNDPYAVNPQQVLHFIDVYFAHVNSATYCMFPGKHFPQRLRHSNRKTPDEMMVVYFNAGNEFGLLTAA